MDTLEVTVRIRREKDHFSAFCPELGIATFGETREEAQEMAKDGIESFLATASEAEIQARLAAYERRLKRTTTRLTFSMSRTESKAATVGV